MKQHIIIINSLLYPHRMKLSSLVIKMRGEKEKEEGATGVVIFNFRIFVFNENFTSKMRENF